MPHCKSAPLGNGNWLLFELLFVEPPRIIVALRYDAKGFLHGVFRERQIALQAPHVQPETLVANQDFRVEGTLDVFLGILEPARGCDPWLKDFGKVFDLAIESSPLRHDGREPKQLR